MRSILLKASSTECALLLNGDLSRKTLFKQS